MSDVTWQALIGGCVTVILAYMQFRTRQKVEEVAKKSTGEVKQVEAKVEQVQEAVEEVQESVEHSGTGTTQRLEALNKLAVDNHTLLNSNMGVQLESVATALREIARLRGNTPGDVAAVDQAEQAYQDHEHKQNIVDIRTARLEQQAKEESE